MSVVKCKTLAGELKKLLAEPTGLHPEEQKLIYKNKERDSKAYLDVARVKDGSKIVLVEDTLSKERRCLEMLKDAKFQKSSELLKQVNLEVDKLYQEVSNLGSCFFFFFGRLKFHKFSKGFSFGFLIGWISSCESL